MAQFEYVPGINTVLNDGNLQPVQTGDTNPSILIIGTASNGPINEPVAVTSKADAQTIFGPVESSTVTRGIFEVFDNTEAGVPDVRGMRIGEPKYANVSIRENQTGTGVNAPTTGAYALKLTARNAGDLYNSFTARFVTSPSFSLKIDNPVTGFTSVFPYSTTSVTAIQDLVNAINVDTNVGPYLLAEYTAISGYFGFAMASGGSVAASGVTISAGQVDLDMTVRWAAASGNIVGDGYTTYPSTRHGFSAPGETNSSLRNVTATAHNKLSNIERLYEVASVNGLVLNPITSTTNLSTFTLPFAPQKYHTNSAIVASLKYLGDVEGVGEWPAAAASGTPEFIATYANHLSDAATSSGQYSFVFRNIMAPPDLGYWPAESGSTCPSGTLAFLTSYASGAAAAGYTAAWCTANSSGLFAKDANYPRFTFKLNLVKSDGSATYPVFDGSVYTDSDVYLSGVYDSDYQGTAPQAVLDIGRWLSYDNSAKTLTVTMPTGVTLSGTYQSWEGLTLTNVAIGDQLSISFTSCRGALSEVTSTTAATGLTQYYYSPTEGTITFGGNLPAVLRVGYRYFDNYVATTDYEIAGTYNQIVRFDNGTHLPGASQSIARGTVGESWVPPQLSAAVTPFSDMNWGAATGSTGVRSGYFFVTGTTVVCNSGAKLPFPLASGATAIATADRKDSIFGIKYTALPEFADTTVATYRLSGGSAGTLNRASFARAATALADAGYDVDYIVPVGIYLDSKETIWNGTQTVEMATNIHKDLETLLAVLHDNYSDTQVVLSVAPPTDFTLTGKKKYYDDLVLIDPSRGITAGNIYRDIAFIADRFKPYFKVTVGDGIFQSAYGNYAAAWNTAYAAWLSSAPYNRSVTNAPLKGVRSAQLLYNGSQLNAITEAGYVAFRQGSAGLVVNAGVTAASIISDYRTEHVLRVTLAAVRAVREACNPFLGMTTDTAIIQSMRAQIESRLHTFVEPETRALNRYLFTINATAAEIAAGKVFIDLTLFPTLEIRRITIRVTLNGGSGITG